MQALISSSSSTTTKRLLSQFSILDVHQGDSQDLLAR
jgi:hypothetical protein